MLHFLGNTKDFFLDNISKVGIPGLMNRDNGQNNVPSAAATPYDMLSQNTQMDEGMISDQQSFYSARDNELENTSLLSYTQHANERITIGENNLRLNIVFNILLIVANLFLLAVDWFLHETPTPSSSAIV